MAGRGLLSAILSEQPDDVLADLQRQLRMRIADARDALAQSESELRLVEQAIAARGGAPPPDAPLPKGDRERDRRADGRFEGIPRARILAVATTVPAPITPVRVVEAFAARGEPVNLEQIRIALNRIAKDGNLSKIGASQFVVPRADRAEILPEPTLGPTQPAPNAFQRSVVGPGISPAWRRTT